MTAGHAGQNHYMVGSLNAAKDKLHSLEDAANAMLHVASNPNYPQSTVHGTAYLVAGIDDVGIRAFTLNFDPLGNPVDPDNPFSQVKYHMLGSGAPHGYSQAIYGNSPFVTTLADTVVEAYSLGMAGVKDRGVNDHLQIGIVTNEGISLINHPSINFFSPNGLNDSIAHLLGEDMPQYSGENVLGEEHTYQVREEQKLVADEVYHILWTQLNAHQKAFDTYMTASANAAIELVSHEEIQFYLAQVKRLRNNINATVQAITDPNTSIREYVAEHLRSQAEMFATS